MRYLIDTQVLIWSIISPERLPNNITSILLNEEIFVSELSIFEIAIKQKIGKLPELNIGLENIINQVQEDGFVLIPINAKHLIEYDLIPLFNQHRDPFDRLLLAVSSSEKMTVISSDSNFQLYVDFINLIHF